MEIIWWIVAAIVLGPTVVYIVLRIATDIRSESRIEKKVAATRRLEVLDGKEFVVTTRSLPIVRELTTGRVGIALERGAENTIARSTGQLALEPRWIRIQFVRKADGKAGRIEWRQSAKFEIVGITNVDFLNRRTGLFKTDSLIRYSANFKDLRSREIHASGSGCS